MATLKELYTTLKSLRDMNLPNDPQRIIKSSRWKKLKVEEGKPE